MKGGLPQVASSCPTVHRQRPTHVLDGRCRHGGLAGKQSPCASGSGLKYSGVPMHYPMPPFAQEVARESTLSWFIRALNGLEPKERREPLRQILGTSD